MSRIKEYRTLSGHRVFVDVEKVYAVRELSKRGGEYGLFIGGYFIEISSDVGIEEVVRGIFEKEE